MPFKWFNPCQPCCDSICEIGFYGDIISQVVDAFPSGTIHANANVNDPETINQPVWGAGNNKPLDIFYYGYTFGPDSCDTLIQPFTLTNDMELFAYNLGQFMLTYGGKILAVAENTAPVEGVSVGCWEDADVDTFNDFVHYMGSGVQSIAYNTNLDLGCQDGTNVVTYHYEPFWQTIISHMNNGVSNIRHGGSTQVKRIPDLGGSLLMSNDDPSKAIIGIEKLGAGYIMVIGDSNMFDSCRSEDSDFSTFLGNYCSLPQVT
tara:strand:+ start:338 stop:1120 length:783 start_codon:yes stop_codon:yes gene_type:complete